MKMWCMAALFAAMPWAAGASAGSPDGSGNRAAGDAAAPRRTVVTAAGATFPLPFYEEAFKLYWEQHDVPVTYAGIGTERGIRALQLRQIDFAGVDVPPTEEELGKMPGKTVLVPTLLGAVEIAYHLEGVDNLRLTGELVADIYLGRVQKWNDSRIAEVNPGVALPDKEIYPVFRLDGSGTTYVFTHYLSGVSEEWREAVGTGTSVKFPEGVGATGTPGVATVIEKVPGAIGYVSSGYAVNFSIQRALLRNAAGKFVQPTPESISAAAAGGMPDTGAMITDSPAAEAYPVSCFTWVLLYADQADGGGTRAEAEQVVSVLRWLVSPEAQSRAAKERYAPLPLEVSAKALELLEGITYNGKKL